MTSKPAREPVLHAPFLSELYAFLREAGRRRTRIYRRAGFASPPPTGSHQADISLNAVAELFEIASEELDDPCFGLHFAQSLEVGHLGIVDHLLLSAATLHNGLTLAARYAQTMISPLEMEFGGAAALMTLRIRFPVTFTARPNQFVDFLAAALVHRIRFGTAPDWTPQTVLLTRAAPEQTPSDYDVFGREVHFGAPAVEMTMMRDELDRRMPGYWPGLSDSVEQTAKHAQDQILRESDIVGQVTQTLLNRLANHQEVGLRRVARVHQLSARSLQWQLGRHDTTYEAVLTGIRTQRVQVLLRDTSLTMSEIGRQLGFSEGSAFTRWARQQFGVPPSELRMMLRHPSGASARRPATQTTSKTIQDALQN